MPPPNSAAYPMNWRREVLLAGVFWVSSGIEASLERCALARSFPPGWEPDLASGGAVRPTLFLARTAICGDRRIGSRVRRTVKAA
ncbi:hypothetical protein GCM10008937_04320 [Deinococcus depolymerans]|uniref:Transposase n=1 Tax=Deinococcus depolymerans TaxID=392408 RepID=A0ABN1BLU8_9DEIO